MPSQHLREQLAIEQGLMQTTPLAVVDDNSDPVLDEHGNQLITESEPFFDPQSFWDHDWQALVDNGTYTREQLEEAAVLQPIPAPVVQHRNPPLRFDCVPIDIDEVAQLDDGTWRVTFTTVADDGYPTVGVVTVADKTDIQAALIEHQKARAALNREAKTKRETKETATPAPVTGTVDAAAAADLDALFPTSR